ncbi:MAG: sugar transferase [Bacteroidales bacterium]|nr:sugar transferase [Bacteroidales bacterium]
MNKKSLVILYVLFDFISASLSWTIFYIYRKIEVEPQVFGYDIPFELGIKFYTGLIAIPLFWLTLYYLAGTYRDVIVKSRLRELGQTFILVLIGVIILFFALILDDVIQSYKDYYTSFFVLAGLQFILTYIPRITLTSIISKKVQQGKIGYNTLMIGSNERAVEIYHDIEQGHLLGVRIVGFINGDSTGEYKLEGLTSHLGSLKDVKQIIKDNDIEEVIIALDMAEHESITNIINTLGECNVRIKAVPDIHDIVTGQVKVTTIFGTPLIQISQALLPIWQENLKRLIDVLFSSLAMILLSPLILFLIIGVKISSRGPVLLRQERIGRFGKPFTLYKFRSMQSDAEKNGPELSRVNDRRITNFGKFMRKRKLDEIPNFWNVLKGEMSLVGPRPERKYFIDQIVQRAPHYIHLHKVKPGITSWGQVKYGYAMNVDEMIKRLKYDLLYIENMSLFVDFQIMIFTVLTLFRGRHI